MDANPQTYDRFTELLGDPVFLMAELRNAIRAALEAGVSQEEIRKNVEQVFQEKP